MTAKIFFCGLLLLSFAGCKPKSAEPPQKNFAAHGIVQTIAADHRHATIKHEAISGYMAAMTMDFPVRDTNALNGLSAGDEITFTLVVTKDDDWIEHLQRTGQSDKFGLSGPPGWHIAESELQVGDELPDAEFTNEIGRPVRFSDFRGSAVAFTFFFTSCPLPEYCPRMNKNFLETRKLLLADTNAPANWQLLSISFDPDVDKPLVLAHYAGLYRGLDVNRWMFAVGSATTLKLLAPKLDFLFWRENGSLSHNLRTVVLDPNGKIFRQFDGNEWTPRQLADALMEAARKK